MQGDVNIRTLFARLKLEHMAGYLPARGWQQSDDARQDCVRYELSDDTDSPYVVILPRDIDVPDGRRLLQRAVYVLSGVEDRQPAEILGDVLATVVPVVCASRPASDPLPVGTGIRLRFENGENEVVSIQLASREQPVTLAPGEAIELICREPELAPLTLRLQGGGLKIVEKQA